MPKGPHGEKRPADVIGNAIKIARIATGEEEDDREPTKSTAAELGSKGGKARARSLNEAERSAIAKKAASARWKKDSPAPVEKERS
ncbi:hypothetical protein ACGGKE_03985 [Sphingobium naphthae]|uniref:hypothetical protein n=1 Tax=Sphingobium naphthae TaxID=1886786 RepID=UPI0037483ED7